MLTGLVLAVAIVGLDKLQPIDEGPQDKQFAEFRANMIAAIKKKNYTYVQSRIADDIEWNFGEGGGKKEMMEEWAFLETTAAFYKELLEVLELGGKFQQYDGTRYFVAPYVFSAWPDAYDPFEFLAATRKDVPVFAQASADSQKIGSLKYEIVARDRADEYQDGWYRISYAGGPNDRGWVQDGAVRNPIDYRAFFQKRHGSWYMVTFIAGD